MKISANKCMRKEIKRNVNIENKKKEPIWINKEIKKWNKKEKKVKLGEKKWKKCTKESGIRGKNKKKK